MLARVHRMDLYSHATGLGAMYGLLIIYMMPGLVHCTVILFTC
jgi:hypothetical protein